MVTLPLRAIGLVVLALAVGGAAWSMWPSKTSADASGAPLDATYRAENGRFVAHHPKRFTPMKTQFPSGMSGLVLADDERAESMVILSYVGGDAPSDPWLVQKKLHGEALAQLPRRGPAYEETSRGDETCLGKTGAVALGKSRTARGEQANVWSCGFSHDGAAYLVMYYLRADSPSEDGRRLREIVEATELTRLAALEAK